MSKTHLVLSCLLGDGSFRLKRMKTSYYPTLDIEHSNRQVDYLDYKRQLLNLDLNRNVKLSKRNTRPMYSLRISNKKDWSAIRGISYINNKKKYY